MYAPVFHIPVPTHATTGAATGLRLHGVSCGVHVVGSKRLCALLYFMSVSVCVCVCVCVHCAMQIQFYMKGPAGTGLVNADMYRDPLTKGEWAYTYLMIDVYSGSNQTPSRLFVVRPQ